MESVRRRLKWVGKCYEVHRDYSEDRYFYDRCTGDDTSGAG